MLSTKTWGEGVKQLYEFMHLGRKIKTQDFSFGMQSGPPDRSIMLHPTEADVIYKAIFWGEGIIISSISIARATSCRMFLSGGN